jgi:hypothetical protein
MRKGLSLLATLLILLPASLWAAGGQETKAYKFRAVIDPIYAPTFKNDPLADDTLSRLIQEKITRKTGVAVTVEWIVPPPDTSRDQYLNMIISSGDIPELLDMNDLAASTDSLKLVDSKGIARVLTADLVARNMPDYAARIVKYGGTVKDVLAANAFNGKNLYVPDGLHPATFPNVPQDILVDDTYYGLYLRDDILKMVMPNARTEAGMKQLLLQKGTLTPADITGDLSIKNMSDLYNYLVKVKALNLKVGDKPVIPGNIFRSSEMPDSTLWSLASATGNRWNWPLIFNSPMDSSYFPYTSPEYKSYMNWLNKFFNAGLLDPETFVMKDDQVRAKVVNGEYAVINWTSPVTDARTTGLQRGYGWRYLPTFYPWDIAKQNNKVVFVSQKGRGPVLTTTIKDADLPVVMKWLDFYFSEAYDEIRGWGSPDWYTGTGANRTYKPEYKAVENWVLYGEQSAKDGEYYHMTPPEPMGYNAQIKTDPITHPPQLSFFGWIATYPGGPFYVMPKDKSRLASVEIGFYSQSAMNKDLQKGITRYRQIGWSADDLNTPKMASLGNNFWGNSKVTGLLAQLVVTKPDQFEATWTSYVALLESYGLSDAQKESAAVLADKFKNASVAIPFK